MGPAQYSRVQEHMSFGPRCLSVHIRDFSQYSKIKAPQNKLGTLLPRMLLFQHSFHTNRTTEVRFPAGEMIEFSLLATAASRPALGPTQLPIQWVPADLFPGLRWLGRKADHSPTSSVEVRNTWSYTSTPHGVVLN
jgi:hypothetical protein